MEHIIETILEWIFRDKDKESTTMPDTEYRGEFVIQGSSRASS